MSITLYDIRVQLYLRSSGTHRRAVSEISNMETDNRNRVGFGSSLLRTRILLDHLKRGARDLSASATSGDEKNKSSATSGDSGKHADIKAVIFDMGGVLVSSPGPMFKEIETALDLPRGCIVKAVMSEGDEGAWAKLETGAISMETFGKEFSAEVSKHAGKAVDLSGMMGSFVDLRPSVVPYPEMIDSIKQIRSRGYKTALLTNIWYDPAPADGDTYIPVETSLFDVIIESCKVRMRKPDPRIYQMTLDDLQVAPTEAVFLDDLGYNLKAAKEMGIRTIKVLNPTQALEDLEKELGHSVRPGFVEGLMEIPDRLKIDVNNLKSYLNLILKLQTKEEPVVKCFEHGQSNPTYFVKYANRNLVLRKKPPGKLLPGAHAVEREYRVMNALRDHGVPVPKVLGLCEDNRVLGTPFYVMEHVAGRIFKDPLCPSVSNTERTEMYRAMNDVLAKIHHVNLQQAGLDNFGKKTNFAERNFRTWARQYENSKTEEIETMNKLMTWLLARMPQNAETTLIHGDFRIDNLIFHPDRPEVVAVLDWELSTTGDPLTDLATNCIGYYLPKVDNKTTGFAGVDLSSKGIPSVDEYIKEYARRRHMDRVPNWEFYVAFVFFRMCAISQGVYKRYTIGQASSPTAEFSGEMAKACAYIGWEIAEKSGVPPSHIASREPGE